MLDEGQLPVLASEKALLPLDDLLDGSDFPVRDGFPPELLRSLSFGGKLYALPLAFNPVFLCYNRRVFRRRGVAEPDGSWNWDDLLRHAELLTDAGPEGVSCYGLAILFTPNSYVPFAKKLSCRITTYFIKDTRYDSYILLFSTVSYYRDEVIIRQE